MSRLTLIPTTPTEAYHTRELRSWCRDPWSLTLRSYLDREDTANTIRVRAVDAALPSLAYVVDGRRAELNRHFEAVAAYVEHLGGTPAYAGDVAFQHWTARAVLHRDTSTVQWKVTIPTRIDVARANPR